MNWSTQPGRSPLYAVVFTTAYMIAIGTIQVRLHAERQGADYERLLADGARPLGEAVLQVERLCHCVITYEDRRWLEEDVQDLPGHVPGPETPKVPKGHPFMFAVRRDVASRNPDSIERSLHDMLTAFEQTNPAGAFRVVRAGALFHIVPRNKSLLDTPITLHEVNRPLSEIIGALLQQVNSSTDQPVRLGTVPTNLMKTNLTVQSTNERGGDVLARALMMTGKNLSWRLLYDFGYQAFYLNIHFVK